MLKIRENAPNFSKMRQNFFNFLKMRQNLPLYFGNVSKSVFILCSAIILQFFVCLLGRLIDKATRIWRKFKIELYEEYENEILNCTGPDLAISTGNPATRMQLEFGQRSPFIMRNETTASNWSSPGQTVGRRFVSPIRNLTKAESLLLGPCPFQNSKLSNFELFKRTFKKLFSYSKKTAKKANTVTLLHSNGCQTIAKEHASDKKSQGCVEIYKEDTLDLHEDDRIGNLHSHHTQLAWHPTKFHSHCDTVKFMKKVNKVNSFIGKTGTEEELVDPIYNILKEARELGKRDKEKNRNYGKDKTDKNNTYCDSQSNFASSGPIPPQLKRKASIKDNLNVCIRKVHPRFSAKYIDVPQELYGHCVCNPQRLQKLEEEGFLAPSKTDLLTLPKYFGNFWRIFRKLKKFWRIFANFEHFWRIFGAFLGQKRINP